MTNISMIRRLLRRRFALFHTVLLVTAFVGMIIWAMSSSPLWLILTFGAVATAVLIIGLQLQLAVDTAQTLKSNSQKRHAALRIALQKLELASGSLREAIDRNTNEHMISSDQQRLRFAEIVDLYQDQADRQQAFEIRARRLIQEKESVSQIVASDNLLEVVWPSVQTHVWLRDLYARAGSIVPRNFLASPASMKASAYLAGIQKPLLDWGIDTLTFQLAQERSRKGKTTIAFEADDRLADLAAQALAGSLKTVSTGSLELHELDYELNALINEPAGLCVGSRLAEDELTRFAALLKSSRLVESVYMIADSSDGNTPTGDTLAAAGFTQARLEDPCELGSAGLQLWQRPN